MHKNKTSVMIIKNYETTGIDYTQIQQLLEDKKK